MLPRRIQAALFTFILSAGPSSFAQQQEPPPQPMFTLHVYTNLIQLPTLILNSDLHPFPPLTREQFTLSVDGGPTFHPTQVRLEGEDPITLALVLDLSGSEDDLMRVAAAAVDGLYPLALTQRDHVAVFALDCTLAQPDHATAAGLGKLKSDLEAAIANPASHGPTKKSSACYRTRHIWDALAAVTTSISNVPGRRVIFALTDGFDHGSKKSSEDVHQLALASSVSIFGIHGNYTLTTQFDALERRSSQGRFADLCNGTGGLVFATTPQTLATTLRHTIELLRGRYILEFPRPSNSTGGSHTVEVKVPKRDPIIRASGVIVPLPNDQEQNDPNTIPPDPNRAPTQGTRQRITH